MGSAWTMNQKRLVKPNLEHNFAEYEGAICIKGIDDRKPSSPSRKGDTQPG